MLRMKNVPTSLRFRRAPSGSQRVEDEVSRRDLVRATTGCFGSYRRDEGDNLSFPPPLRLSSPFSRHPPVQERKIFNAYARNVQRFRAAIRPRLRDNVRAGDYFHDRTDSFDRFRLIRDFRG
jgi:hypothetical protein